MRRLVVLFSSMLIVYVLLRTATLRRLTPASQAPPFDPDAVLEEMATPALLVWAQRSQQLLRDSRADSLRAANPTSSVATASIVPTAATADAPAVVSLARVVSRVSLADACEELSPAVAVRPAPSGSLASQLAVEAGPWQWAGSQASLTFDPDGLAGLLVTPWGEGRWGEAQPGLLWADWSGRTHLLRMRGAALTSYRCADGERLEATATAKRAAAATPIRRACAAPSAAAGAGGGGTPLTQPCHLRGALAASLFCARATARLKPARARRTASRQMLPGPQRRAASLWVAGWRASAAAATAPRGGLASHGAWLRHTWRAQRYACWRAGARWWA